MCDTGRCQRVILDVSFSCVPARTEKATFEMASFSFASGKS